MSEDGKKEPEKKEEKDEKTFTQKAYEKGIADARNGNVELPTDPDAYAAYMEGRRNA